MTSRLGACYRRKWMGLAVLSLASSLYLLAHPSSGLAVEIYRWSDSAGIIHFSDAPPDDGHYDPVTIDETEPRWETDEQPVRLERERRFEQCVSAQRQFIRSEREALHIEQPTAAAIGGASDVPRLPFMLEPPLTDTTSYWSTASKRWEFVDLVPNSKIKTYMRDITEYCELGTAVEERQLASVNAAIQESNCQLLRQRFPTSRSLETLPPREHGAIKQLLKNLCG